MDQGLNQAATPIASTRSAQQLPKLERGLAIDSTTLSNAVKSPSETSVLLQDFCKQPGVSLATPACDGWRLVSFGRDFERFGDLQRLELA